jgi:hypothetical protein
MPALLADVNAAGHLDALLSVWRGADWLPWWSALGATVQKWGDLGFPPTVADDVLWRLCQACGLVLVTSNRNQKGADSLGATIARENTTNSLPVLTFADADRLLADRAYCEDAAVRLIEILMDLDHLRGSGRLWLP